MHSQAFKLVQLIKTSTLASGAASARTTTTVSINRKNNSAHRYMAVTKRKDRFKRQQTL